MEFECESLQLVSRFAGEKEQKDIFSNDDIAIEILSRLPTESTRELKCVSKRWCVLFSCPSFINANFQRFRGTISGLFVQGTFRCTDDCCGNFLDYEGIDYISIDKEQTNAVFKKCLDFLPERVVITGSSNGILLCRSFFEVNYPDHRFDRRRGNTKEHQKKIMLYVCNPLTKEWAVIQPRGKYQSGCCYGFSYDPFLSSFEVVMVQRPWLEKDPYLFKVYSSQTGKWRISKEACTLSAKDQINLHQSCFTDGVFYWLTTKHNILAFDLKQERSQINKLPGHVLFMEGREGLCLGISQGKLHYVCFNMDELVIWGFEDNKWVLKHLKPQCDMHCPLLGAHWKRRLHDFSSSHKVPNAAMHPYALRGDILFMKVLGCMCTYNIKTEEFEDKFCVFSQLESADSKIPIMLPYCKSLLSVKLTKIR
ncbi:hypothetical protein ACHQM5_019233 [Ranunculus cassubicifolius]